MTIQLLRETVSLPLASYFAFTFKYSWKHYNANYSSNNIYKMFNLLIQNKMS